MNKRHFSCAAVMLTALTFTACQNAEEYSDWGEPTPITLNANIKGYIPVRASGTAWTANDAIGVYMTPTKGTLTTAIKSNIKYVTTGGSTFTAPNEPLYFPKDGGAVDFLSYYPYTSTLTENKLQINVSNQSKPEAIDLMVAKAEKVTATTPAPALVFEHQLSKIKINLTAGTGVADLKGIKVTLKGTNTQASYDLATQKLGAASAPADVQSLVTDNGNTAEAIILPRAAAAGMKIIFTLGAENFTYEIPETKAFNVGEMTVYDATLSKTATGETAATITATIKDWVTSPGGNININFGTTTTEEPVKPEEPISPKTGEESTLFVEGFGATVEKDGNFWPSIDKYTGWDNKSLTFSDPIMAGSYSQISIRKTSTLPSPHVWIAAKKNAELKIAGIVSTGYKTLTLSYEIAANGSGVDQNVIQVKAGDKALTVPSATIEASNKFQTVTIKDIPLNVTSISFVGDATTNTTGYRIDNIKLVGTK